MSQLFAWGGQSIGVSALASFIPMNTQDWSSLGWTGWISLQSKALLINIYEEDIMWNAQLDEAEAGIKIAGRSINNFRCADATTLKIESEK